MYYLWDNLALLKVRTYLDLKKFNHKSPFKTRLRYNCAHLRSTKESLTDSVKFFFLRRFFCVKIFLGENLLGEHFLSEHFFLGEHFFE